MSELIAGIFFSFEKFSEVHVTVWRLFPLKCLFIYLLINRVNKFSDINSGECISEVSD